MAISEDEPMDTKVPRVMAVFVYSNPGAPRTPEEVYKQLIDRFERANCHNLAKFLEFVQFEEKSRGMTLSYNLSLAPPTTDPHAPRTSDDVAAYFAYNDILVGSRYGEEGAIAWFTLLSQKMDEALPGRVQFVDKIFGLALVHVSSPLQTTTVQEMERVVFGEIPFPTNNPESKH